MLSGFILAYTYLPGGTLRAFWVARVARIYPLYVIAFLVAAPPFYWGHALNPVKVGVAALALMQAWSPSMALAWNPPGWSLSVEAFFYLLFPWLGVALARLDRRRLVACIALLWLLGAVVPVSAVALLHMRVLSQPRYDSGWLSLVLHNPLLNLPAFLIGVATGRLYLLRGAGRAHAGWRDHWQAPLAPLVVVIGSPLTLVAAARLPWSLGQTELIAPVWAIVLYVLACSRGRSAALLSLPALVTLGEASYALYLLHVPAWFLLTRWIHAPLASRPWACLAFFGAYLLVVVGLSVLVRHYIEQPARHYIRFVFDSGALRLGRHPWPRPSPR